MNNPDKIYDFFPSTPEIKQSSMSTEELNQRITKLIAEEKLGLALHYTAKAIAQPDSRLAGLLLRHTILLKQLIEMREEGITSQTGGFKALSDLFLAKILLQQSPDLANGLPQDIAAQLKKNPDEFWSKKIEILIKLTNIEGQEAKAQSVANDVYQQVFQPNQS